jgi:hypothetical protein
VGGCRIGLLRRGGLLGRGYPTGVGVEEEEEDQAEGHEIHVDAKDDAGMIEAPTTLHATDCIGCAGDGKQGGEDEERGGAIVGEVGEEKSDGETGENQEVAAQKRVGTRIEEGMFHAGTTSRISAQLVWCQFVGGQSCAQSLRSTNLARINRVATAKIIAVETPNMSAPSAASNGPSSFHAGLIITSP